MPTEGFPGDLPEYYAISSAHRGEALCLVRGGGLGLHLGIAAGDAAPQLFDPAELLELRPTEEEPAGYRDYGKRRADDTRHTAYPMGYVPLSGTDEEREHHLRCQGEQHAREQQSDQ